MTQGTELQLEETAALQAGVGTMDQVLADIEPWPDALKGGAEDLNLDVSDQNYYQTLAARDVPFFKLALLQQIKLRPYHVASKAGPFDLVQISRDFKDVLYRSDVTFTPTGKLQVNRLFL